MGEGDVCVDWLLGCWGYFFCVSNKNPDVTTSDIRMEKLETPINFNVIVLLPRKFQWIKKHF